MKKKYKTEKKNEKTKMSHDNRHDNYFMIEHS